MKEKITLLTAIMRVYAEKVKENKQEEATALEDMARTLNEYNNDANTPEEIEEDAIKWWLEYSKDGTYRWSETVRSLASELIHYMDEVNG